MIVQVVETQQRPDRDEHTATVSAHGNRQDRNGLIRNVRCRPEGGSLLQKDVELREGVDRTLRVGKPLAYPRVQRFWPLLPVSGYVGKDAFGNRAELVHDLDLAGFGFPHPQLTVDR